MRTSIEGLGGLTKEGFLRRMEPGQQAQDSRTRTKRPLRGGGVTYVELCRAGCPSESDA